MRLHPGRLQWTVFALVSLAIIANAVAPWSLAASNRMDNALQLAAGLLATMTATRLPGFDSEIETTSPVCGSRL